MKAVILPEFGGIENLKYTDVETPKLKINEILIKIEAIGINPVDAKARQGKAFAAKMKYVEFPIILGKDVAGTVVALGNDVTDFEIGDRVFGIPNQPGFAKTYAEYVATPTQNMVKIPDGISFEAAAASPVAALTALQALSETIQLSKDDSVLIHAGAGGVGHFAIQYAKYIGAHVTASSSKKNKKFILETLGAEAHIDYKKVDYKAYEDEYDVVLDLVGLHSIDDSILVTRPGGDVLCVPSNSFELFLEKVQHKPVNGHTVMMHADKTWMQKLAELLEQEILVPHVSESYSLSEMQAVHKQIETGATRGKIIVKP
ncbi:NADPH:quinone reductase [Pustulibacterium marinum]|uniref:NADPH:quinone reductase n=1 Tax=Pustulibacterium marinum TaxID=1224947 RepID=A0A1I7I7C3_9FLAO|nr:NADP-dependent oxidoreductase [Pustulibacterium marinum]SFU68847.1 NADPH:quinone reductase [Pustulibacterium marinum]